MSSHLALAVILLLIFNSSACIFPFRPASSPNATVVFQEAVNNPNTWVWVDRTDMKTRTGANTGFGIYFQDPAASLVIFLAGGGACFSDFTCAGNPTSFGGQNDLAQNLNKGIFDFSNPDNPVKDWNFIYLPYTTGDLHFGQSTAPNPSQNNSLFVGYDNYQAMLNLASSFFVGVEKVLVCGSSAGGFGATFNYETTLNAFGNQTATYLINDSGPFLYDDNVLSPCLQERFRNWWNLDIGLPTACTPCFSQVPDGLANLYDYLIRASNNYGGHLGMISFDQDSVVGKFYGLGQNECAALDTKLSWVDYSPAALKVGMDGLNAHLNNLGWSTFFPNGEAHTTLSKPLFYVDDGRGHTIADWTAQLLKGQQLNW